MSIPPENWYIIPADDHTCIIQMGLPEPTPEQVWGPFENRETAIARRVGLIRAGKCKPVGLPLSSS
jgi:hypothetical protein